MKGVSSILLMVFGAMMLSALAVMALAAPPPSMTWWEFKLKAVTFIVPLGAIPFLIGTLLRPQGNRLKSVGIAMSVLTGYCLLQTYIFAVLFGMNEEIGRLDPKFAFRFDDYMLCFVVTAVYGIIGGLCLFATRKPQPVQP